MMLLFNGYKFQFGKIKKKFWRDLVVTGWLQMKGRMFKMENVRDVYFVTVSVRILSRK